MGLYGNDPPPPPDQVEATRAAYDADIQSLPARKKIEAGAKMGKLVTWKDRNGLEHTSDFRGFGDIDQSREELDFLFETAHKSAEEQLAIQKEFGGQYVEQRLKELEQSDPIGHAVRQQMGEMAKADLDAGYDLDEGLRNQVTQGVRGAQAARGNILGNAPAAAEGFAVGDAAIRLRQQRLSNAASFLSGIAPVAQFGAISGAQQGASPFAPLGIQQGIGGNPNAGAQGLSFAANNYNTASANARASQENSIGGTLLGAAGGIAMGALTGGIGGALAQSTNMFTRGAGVAMGGTAPKVT